LRRAWQRFVDWNHNTLNSRFQGMVLIEALPSRGVRFSFSFLKDMLSFRCSFSSARKPVPLFFCRGDAPPMFPAYKTSAPLPSILFQFREVD